MRTLHSSIRRALAAFFATAAIAAFGCNQGRAGDRCNASLNTNGHDECGGGLTCLQPDSCPETYCCPTNPDGTLAKSDNPNCQPGCNGGAASICNASSDVDACAIACATDPQDLADAGVCSSQEAGAGDAAPDASDAAPEAAPEAGPRDGGSDSAKPADGGAD